MAPTIPTVEPTEVRAGDTWVWDATYPETPAGDFVLTYAVRGKSSLNITAAMAVASGTGWRVTVPATTTAAIKEDSYEFLAILTGAGSYAGQVYTTTLPRLNVLANLSIAGVGDRVAHCQLMLEQVRSVIAARLNGDEPQFYAVDGTSVQRMALKDLYEMETRYAQRLRRLRNPSAFGTKVQYRMREPT